MAGMTNLRKCALLFRKIDAEVLDTAIFPFYKQDTPPVLRLELPERLPLICTAQRLVYQQTLN